MPDPIMQRPVPGAIGHSERTQVAHFIAQETTKLLLGQAMLEGFTMPQTCLIFETSLVLTMCAMADMQPSVHDKRNYALLVLRHAYEQAERRINKFYVEKA